MYRGVVAAADGQVELADPAHPPPVADEVAERRDVRRLRHGHARRYAGDDTASLPSEGIVSPRPAAE